MTVRVTFLGSGDAFGSGGRLQACILVEHDGGSFLLDCGASALAALKRGGHDPNAVGTILLSHLHGDHFAGIPFLVLDAQFVAKRTDPLVVAGPRGTAERLERAMEILFPGSARAPRRFDLRVQELQPRRPTPLNGITVTAFEVVHASGAPALALRVERDGRVLAYSGDTEWTDALVEVADGADLFVAEAYCFDRRVKYHLDYATLRANHDRLRAKRIVVTHMSADMLDRSDEVDYERAEDGTEISLP